MKWCLQFMIPIWWMWFHVIGTLGDVGTAASYHPPYLPTKCGGYSEDQFPENGFFASVSEGLWDNGAACGRRYEVCCISGPNRPCKDGNIIATVVDFCRTSPCPATMVLSLKAFSAICRTSTAKINIEYAQM